MRTIIEILVIAPPRRQSFYRANLYLFSRRLAALREHDLPAQAHQHKIFTAGAGKMFPVSGMMPAFASTCADESAEW
jgi:hypothetical protein